LSDPEGNGLEIYADRPRDMWQYTADGSVKMATLAVDVHSMMDEAPQAMFTGLPDGTTMGHVHLQVRDKEETIAFYRDVVGFDLMADWPGAGFLGVGGYHHHLGTNVWRSAGSNPPPPGSLGLLSYTLILTDRDALIARLEQHNHPLDLSGDHPTTVDPAGNTIILMEASTQ
ncbi:MAG: VOC family protein, partial [Okeania sp. SIO3B3]|nr:VOC family protein [Okeania sp. SIO3B3]